jgi:hypothetical protein
MPVADDHRRSSPAASGPADRETLIDTLLMAGLDEYFAGRYERAIHVWSRVFFLDRTHARARAYIERARGAVAERQREAEARAGRDGHDLAGSGGPVLLEGGGAADRLRLASLDPPAVLGALAARADAPLDPAGESRAAAAAVRPPRRHVHTILVSLAGLVLFMAGYTVAARDRLADWWAGRADQVSAVELAPATPGPLPAEAALNLARQALAARRFDEARRALALIPAGDPLRRHADALLAELQLAIGGRGRGVSANPPAGPTAGAHLQ